MGDPARKDDSDDELERFLAGGGSANDQSDPELDSFLSAKPEAGPHDLPSGGAAAAAPPQTAPAKALEQTPPERGILERFLDSAREGVSDAGTALKPYGNALHRALDPGGHMDMGADFSDARVAADRSDAAAAHERSPIASGVASAVATAPVGAAFAGPAAGGAAMGAADSAAGGGSGRDQLLHAFLGGAVGQGAEWAGKGLQAAQKYAAPFADSLERGASRARVAATGIYGGAMKKLRGELGDEGITKLGNDIESKGLHDAPGVAGMFPGSAERYLDNSTALADDALVRQRTAAFDAVQRGVAVPTGRIADELEGQAAYHSAQFDPAGETAGNFAQKLADRFRGKSAATAQYDPATGQPVAGDYQLPFDQALDRRQYLDEGIKWAQRNPHIQMPREEELRRYGANQLRGELTNALDEQAPDLAGPFRDAQSDLNTALTVQTPAAARVYQEAGNQAVSLPTWIAGAGGIASGNPITGAAMGGLASQVKARGHSAVAGALRGAQHAAEDVGSDPQIAMLSKFLQSPGAGIAAGGTALSQPSAAPVQETPHESQVRASSGGRGYLLPDVINDVLKTNPDQLGQWRGQFEQAGRSPDGIRNLIARLRTDQKWRMTKLPELQSMTQGDQ